MRVFVCTYMYVFVVVQLLSHVWLLVTPWTAAYQASLSLTTSWSLPKFTFVESVMPSYHLILCHPLLLLPSMFPSIRVFSNAQLSIGASALTSVLSVSIQYLFPSGLTDLISLQSKRLSRVFSSTTIWKHQFFGTQPSLWSNSHILYDYWEYHNFGYTDLCQHRDVSAF